MANLHMANLQFYCLRQRIFDVDPDTIMFWHSSLQRVELIEYEYSLCVNDR